MQRESVAIEMVANGGSSPSRREQGRHPLQPRSHPAFTHALEGSLMWWRLMLLHLATVAAFVALWVGSVIVFQQFAPCAWLSQGSTPNNRMGECMISAMESLQ